MHVRSVCSCGALLAQCKCPGPHANVVILNGCQTCKVKAALAPTESK